MILVDILYFVLYLSICILCVRVAKLETGSYISITSMFTLPYMFICIFQEFVCLTIESFDLPSFEYWSINILFITTTCITEVGLLKLTNMNKIKHMFEHSNKKYTLSRLLLVIATFVIILTVVSSIKMLGSIDLNLLLQDEFQNEFETSTGGNFYIRLITIILAVYFLGISKSRWGYILGILCFLPHIIINTKGILFIPIISILLTRVMMRRITNLKYTFFILGVAGTFIFFSSYLLENLIYQQEVDFDRLLYIGEKLVVYLIAGVQEFYVNLRDGIVHNSNLVNITLVPLNNLLAKFGIGESISNVNQEFNRVIGILPHYGTAQSNVNGYIGTLYLFNGCIGGIAYHIILITITFLIRRKALLSQQPFWIVLQSLFLSAFFLGWFEFYFMHTFWIYFIIITIFINWLSKIVIK